MGEISFYEAKKAISVKELIELLEKYPQDLKCLFTWESTLRAVEPEDIYQANSSFLLLDADDGLYKEDYENSLKMPEESYD